VRRDPFFQVLIAAIALAACRKPAPASGEATRDGAQARAPARVHVATGVQADAKIRTERVVRDVLAAAVELPGEIVSQSDRTARVSSPVAGRLDDIKFGEGDVVKKGETLAVLRVPDLGRIRGALAAAEAKASAARADATRTKGLLDKQLATEQAWLDAQAGSASLEAEAAALREQLAAMGVAAEGGSGHQLVLRAPVAGIVVSREAVVGQPLRSDQTIATLADLSRVWFVGRVFERDLPLVQMDAPADVRLSAIPARRYEGRVDLVSRALDPATRSASVRIPLENPDGTMRIGMTGTVRVRSGDAGAAPSAPVVSVPRAALSDIVGRRVVFVRTSPEEFAIRDVETASSVGDRIAVTRGVDDGEEVVVDGVFTLKSIALKSSFAEE
jgi:membrane fusion protein, heavy metal efflux system